MKTRIVPSCNLLSYLIAGAAPVLGGCPGAGPSAEFVAPPELTPVDGVVNGTIETRFADNELVVHDAVTGEVKLVPIHTRTFNGTVPGPTLRLRAGQRLDLELVNSLPHEHEHEHGGAGVNFPHNLNSWNFHLHGLHVDPTGAADNVLRELRPQTRARVDLEVPTDHNAGLFWYHPHKHGAAMVQFLSGMSGAVIIEGDLDEVPEIAAATERVMLIQEIGVDDAGQVPDPDPEAEAAEELYKVTQTYFAINGIVNPILRMRPGEVSRLRMINATRGRFLNVSMEDHTWLHIATDGVTLDAVREVGNYEIAAGGRFEALVKAGAPGEYSLMTAPLTAPTGKFPDPLVLATVVIEGEPVEMALPVELPQPDDLLPDTRGRVPDDYRKTEFSVLPSGLNAFQLDGKLYRPDCYDHVLQRGDLVEWTFENTSEDPHPFHIHTNSFQVLAVNDVALDPPIWHDTVKVPPMGSVTARMRIDDFVGAMVLHCHIINHEDLGMMQNVVIVDDSLPQAQHVSDPGIDPDDPAQANPAVPGYYVSENFPRCE